MREELRVGIDYLGAVTALGERGFAHADDAGFGAVELEVDRADHLLSFRSIDPDRRRVRRDAVPKVHRK